MYSQSEIQSAIDAGIIDSNAAEKLQNHIAQMRDRPIQDEEHFKLVTGFNDIFVAIAAIIMLFAAGGIGFAINDFLGGFFVAATAWGLAEFFTRKRRMAFPSIILLLAFVGGIFVAILMTNTENNDSISVIALPSIVTTLAAALHWFRFKVPITVAAGAAAIAGTVISIIMIVFADGLDWKIIYSLVLIVGLAIFAYAMWWDISDKARKTGRSDVAFWLHLLAAPMIAHPLFYFIGATSGDEISGLQVAAVLATYIVMAIIAITIDRRAMLVSALAYVLVALTFLFNQFGFIELNIALTAFVIGSALLLLSAFWSNLRKAIITKMPDIIRNNVPATE